MMVLTGHLKASPEMPPHTPPPKQKSGKAEESMILQVADSEWSSERS